MATTATTAAELNAGKLDKRLEAAIPSGLDAAITARAKQLAGTRNAKMFRSKAARDLLTRGVIAYLEDEAKEAARTQAKQARGK